MFFQESVLRSFLNTRFLCFFQGENVLRQNWIAISNFLTITVISYLLVVRLKLWPQKRWKQILLIAVLTIVIVLASLLAYMIFAIGNDVVTDVMVKNAEGSETALMLYHPGLSSFAHDVAYAFADGLVSGGWRVEIATPSSEAPTDASDYGLLVLCFSTYGGKPDSPTTRHLERMGDLGGVNVVLVGLAGGDAQGSTAIMRDAVEYANGVIILEKAWFNMAPNEGDKAATVLAEETGQGLAP